MAQIDKIKDKPKGKPVKTKAWKDTKQLLKDYGYKTEDIERYLGSTSPKYSTDIELADAIRELMGVTYA